MKKERFHRANAHRILAIGLILTMLLGLTACGAATGENAPAARQATANAAPEAAEFWCIESNDSNLLMVQTSEWIRGILTTSDGATRPMYMLCAVFEQATYLILSGDMASMMTFDESDLRYSITLIADDGSKIEALAMQEAGSPYIRLSDEAASFLTAALRTPQGQMRLIFNSSTSIVDFTIPSENFADMYREAEYYAWAAATVYGERSKWTEGLCTLNDGTTAPTIISAEPLAGTGTVNGAKVTAGLTIGMMRDQVALSIDVNGAPLAAADSDWIFNLTFTYDTGLTGCYEGVIYRGSDVMQLPPAARDPIAGNFRLYGTTRVHIESADGQVSFDFAVPTDSGFATLYDQMIAQYGWPAEKVLF